MTQDSAVCPGGWAEHCAGGGRSGGPRAAQVLKGKELVRGRPGASMAAVNLKELEGDLTEK